MSEPEPPATAQQAAAVAQAVQAGATGPGGVDREVLGSIEASS
jgi:hypothetical protein